MGKKGKKNKHIDQKQHALRKAELRFVKDGVKKIAGRNIAKVKINGIF